MPALNAHIVLHYGRERYGQTFGILALVAGMASAASPILGGWMWDNISPQSPFILNLVLAIIIGFIIWFKIKEPTPAAT
jgi:MFS family permease